MQKIYVFVCGPFERAKPAPFNLKEPKQPLLHEPKQPHIRAKLALFCSAFFKDSSVVGQNCQTAHQGRS
jgi:hypothetical protein